jgi:16S rRNA processing protein RimM
MSTRLCLGAISGARGVRGEVRIKTFTAVAADIAAYGPLSDEAGTRLLVIETVKPSKEGVVAIIEGVRDRDAAEALKGLRLYVERDVLPEPAEDEYYFADLIGLRAEREDGEVIGTVAALNDFGAGELIEIERQGAMPVVLPFTKEAIPLVSLAEGRIVVAVNDEILADEALKSAENSAANRRTKKRRERKKRQK